MSDIKLKLMQNNRFTYVTTSIKLVAILGKDTLFQISKMFNHTCIIGFIIIAYYKLNSKC